MEMKFFRMNAFGNCTTVECTGVCAAGGSIERNHITHIVEWQPTMSTFDFIPLKQLNDEHLFHIELELFHSGTNWNSPRTNQMCFLKIAIDKWAAGPLLMQFKITKKYANFFSF